MAAEKASPAHDAQLRRVRIVVAGRVQGVGYRYFCKTRALQLGVSGWVRNEANGVVALLAIASKATIEDFIRELRRGPPSASVESVDVQPDASTDEFTSFFIY